MNVLGWWILIKYFGNSLLFNKSVEIQDYFFFNVTLSTILKKKLLLPWTCQTKLVLILVWVFTTNNDDDSENLGLHGPASTIFSISTIISW